MKIKNYLATLFLFLSATVSALEFNSRVSMFASAGKAHTGDIGDKTGIDILTADQQSFRLMLGDSGQSLQWSIHVKTSRQHLKGITASTNHSSDLFRFDELAHQWVDDQDNNSRTRAGIEVDQAFFKYGSGDFSFDLGRQPVDWGSGRFWQPLNIFGSFAPTDLDTEYKPGIDALVASWYPSSFSSLEVVYAFAPNDEPDIEDSGALFYSRQVGQNSAMHLLAGNIVDNTVFGASFESDWKGIGWRIEGAYYDLNHHDNNEWFWIAGLDYLFNSGTLFSLEWYNNDMGASHQSSLANRPNNIFDNYGLKQHLGRQLVGVSLNRDITPLLNGSYSVLLGALKDDADHHEISLLHQADLVCSLSNESELVLSLQYASGEGLDQQNNIHSEFGHFPASLTLIYRHYF